MLKPLLAVLCACPMLAHATPVTIYWSGQLTSITDTNYSGTTIAEPLSSTAISGKVTYDPTAEDPSGAFLIDEDNFVLYQSYSGAGFVSNTLSFAGQTFAPKVGTDSFDWLQALRGDAGQNDSFSFVDEDFTPAHSEDVHWTIQGVGLLADPSPFLPTADLSHFLMGSGDFSTIDNGTNYHSRDGKFLITSVSAQPPVASVPEPGTNTLLMSGIALIMLGRGLRQARRMSVGARAV